MFECNGSGASALEWSRYKYEDSASLQKTKQFVCDRIYLYICLEIDSQFFDFRPYFLQGQSLPLISAGTPTLQPKPRDVGEVLSLIFAGSP